MTSRSFMRPAETFYKKIYAWLHVHPLYQNHIYTILSPCFSSSLSKLNSQLSHCAFFFSWQLFFNFNILIARIWISFFVHIGYPWPYWAHLSVLRVFVLILVDSFGVQRYLVGALSGHSKGYRFPTTLFLFSWIS